MSAQSTSSDHDAGGATPAVDMNTAAATFVSSLLAEDDEHSRVVEGSGGPELPKAQLYVEDRLTEFQDHELLKSAFAKGVDLREYAKQIEKELDELEQAHVLDYVKQSPALADLHSQIQSCDNILEHMESLLSDFQATLGKISEEIETLQEQSHTMNIKLKNRTNLETLLNAVLDGVVISPDLIKKICEGEVNDFFLTHLNDLNKKMSYVKAQQNKHVRAFKDVGPELERLRLKATEKIREFLLRKIESLRAPNTNIAMIQQSVLLKYKDLYWFLLERYADAAGEIRVNYVNTVGGYYLMCFDKYLKSMQRLQTVIADKFDLIGYEESVKKGLFSGKLALKDKTNVFTLGDRLQVLTNPPDTGIILPHIAEDRNLRFPFEAIFKSINRLLMDNASSEYIFDIEFFAPSRVVHKPGVANAPGSELMYLQAVFMETFDSTLKLLAASNKQYVDASFDAVGILLCIRLNMQNIMIQQKRCVPCLENYMNATNMVLWPRFQAIMDMHIESVKKAIPGKLLPTKDVHPHYLTRRYAEFSASILTLNQGYDDALLINSLQRLRTEVEALLFRMSGEFSDRKSRLVFMINNYDLVASILTEHTASSFDQEKDYFGGMLTNKTTEFVEEELKPVFGFLMNFVNHGELEQDVNNIQPEKFDQVASEFTATWKNALNSINASVIQSFPNFQNGARVLQSVLTRLVLYYRRFLTLYEKRFGNGKKRSVQPVGLQSLMVELKK
ncbi:hypothetical protein SmJEL517_g00456 [Synchytrium microbalum]|uniref:Uncharacterized protein n=1 Tax=Synchytrium microbalum TaxID=1806994 RepID=A0A507CDZ0_9FUNG|nr:uncharacterized protein SmJEL517_g00456 [Synchytrium microbalum]TPX37558.1 hypothetical protein SmJEL517_g00456 [Synchytrium microbalum]